MKDVSLEERVTKLESIVNMAKSEMYEILIRAYKEAVEREDEESASMLARKIRNRLLAESDPEYALDRLNLDLTDTESFMNSLNAQFENEWGVYRQELRDIPEQEGFPFNIVFPEKPSNPKEVEEKQTVATTLNIDVK